MLNLPEAYLQQMKMLLPEDEYKTFVDSYQVPATRGLRANTMKIRPESLAERVPFDLQPVPWCPAGFYYSGDDRPGKHPYHDAGLYYIQEPSAMAVVEQLDPQPGEWVLDLCAAPGGKSTHIAAKLNGAGWLVSNEIHGQRVKALAENLERFGVRNATVLNASPQLLASRFNAFFHRILVDAPCSGEGMFRKNPDAVCEWSEENVAYCEQRQQEILAAAVPMLRPGGRLVYSTCTFNDRENEAVIAHLLRSFPELELVDMQKCDLFAPGLAGRDDAVSVAKRVIRLWPHRLRGEGHFIAVLEKRTDSSAKSYATNRPQTVQRHTLASDLFQLLKTFEEDVLESPLPMKNPVLFGSHLYETAVEMPDLQGIKVERPGFYLGEFKKKRFEPSHALAMCLKAVDARLTIPLTMEHPAEVEAYLRGETVRAEREQEGWTLVTVDRFPLGWGKQVGRQVKNHLPKRLRRKG